MDIAEKSDEIIIRHTPVGKWICGGLLIFLFFGIFTLFVSYLNSDNSLHLCLVGLFILVGLMSALIEASVFPLLFAPQMNVTVSRKIGSVDITSRRVYGANTRRYFFHQIQKFKSQKGKTRFSSSYSLVMILANGKTLKLEIPIGDDKNETVKLIKKLNRFSKPPKI